MLSQIGAPELRPCGKLRTLPRAHSRRAPLRSWHCNKILLGSCGSIKKPRIQTTAQTLFINAAFIKFWEPANELTLRAGGGLPIELLLSDYNPSLLKKLLAVFSDWTRAAGTAAGSVFIFSEQAGLYNAFMSLLCMSSHWKQRTRTELPSWQLVLFCGSCGILLMNERWRGWLPWWLRWYFLFLPKSGA